jgi:hypothetical protein
MATNEIIYMTLKRAGSTLAKNLRCQLDTVNIPLELMGRQDIPTDLYDLYSLGWDTPAPQRGDYFTDQATNITYQVYGNPYIADATIQMRVTRYLGVTP